MRRYWDFSLPSAEVHPTTISKVSTPKSLSDFPLCVVYPYFCFILVLWRIRVFYSLPLSPYVLSYVSPRAYVCQCSVSL